MLPIHIKKASNEATVSAVTKIGLSFVLLVVLYVSIPDHKGAITVAALWVEASVGLCVGLSRTQHLQAAHRHWKDHLTLRLALPRLIEGHVPPDVIWQEAEAEAKEDIDAADRDAAFETTKPRLWLSLIYHFASLLVGVVLAYAVASAIA